MASASLEDAHADRVERLELHRPRRAPRNCVAEEREDDDVPRLAATRSGQTASQPSPLDEAELAWVPRLPAAQDETLGDDPVGRIARHTSRSRIDPPQR